MKFEIKSVEQAYDKLIKNQWGKGFFFKKDGKKQTFIPKRFLWIIGTLFLFVVIATFFQTPPHQESTQSSFPMPQFSGVSSTQQIDVPRIEEFEASFQNHLGFTRQKQTPKYSAPQLVTRPKLGQIPPGLMAKAVLSSGASNGMVRAELTENIQINGEILIEAGTVFVGHGSSTDERLFISFDKIVLHDGAVESIRAQACDVTDKIVGIKGSKIGTHAWKIAGGVGLGFIGGLSTGLQDSHAENGAVVHDSTLRNAMLNGAATAALEESRDIMSSVKDKASVIEVKEGIPIYIMTE
jgi:hypothetical protein